MKDYEETLYAMSDEEADYAMSLRGDLFWSYLEGREADD